MVEFFFLIWPIEVKLLMHGGKLFLKILIWFFRDVVLHPQISKAFRMTSGTLHEVCAAHCHGQVQLGPPQAAADVCGKISGTISRQDPRFYEWDLFQYYI